MLTIQCTKKLLEELKIDVNKEKVFNNDAIFSWHSNLFVLNRKKCVLLMNNKSRFNFVLFGLKKADFQSITSLVKTGIKENLLAENIEEALVDKYLQSFNKVVYTTTSDRSIISQMNEMIKSIEYIFLSDKTADIETDIYKLNRWLNSFVMLKLPNLYSGETMKADLIGLFSK